MNKLFKMSLFKKTFLIILCGLSIIEGIHLYLDYENEKRDTIGSFVRNRSDIVSILSELETENEGKSFSLEEAIELLDDPLKNLGEYFSITNFEGDVLYECKNSSYFSGYQRIYDSNISEINVSVFSNEDIKRIESYILNNKNITLKITYQGKKEQDNSIIPTYLSINDQLIIGEKNINEKIYESHMHMYRGGEIYYQDDDSGENTKSLVFIKEEYFNKMREISNDIK